MYQFLYFPIGKQEFQFTSAKFEIEHKKTGKINVLWKVIRKQGFILQRVK